MMIPAPIASMRGRRNPEWDPLHTSLAPGLICDLCPDYAATLTTSSGRVTRINDRTSYANDFQHTGGTSGPTLGIEPAYGGRTSLAFAGAQQMQTVNPISGFTASGKSTVCVVFTQSTTGDQGIFMEDAANPPVTGAYAAFLSGAYYHRGFRVGSADVNNSAGTYDASPVRYVWTTDLQSSTPTAATYKNGTSIATNTGSAGTGQYNGSVRWTLGSLFNGYYFNGHIARVLVWNRILSPSEIAALDAGLQSFFGSTYYAGQVATRSSMPQDYNAAITAFMARSNHITRDSVSVLKLAFPNFYSKSESAPGGAAIITASVEYPAGTFTQIRFGGSTSGTIANGGMIWSDAAQVAIPANTRFWVRAYVQNAAGCVYAGRGGDNANGDALSYNGFASDTTMSDPMPTGSVNNLMYPPAAIVAKTRNASVYLLGDSRCFGNTDVPNDSTGDIGEIARAIGPARAYINGGVSGEKAAEFITTHAKRLELAGYCSHVVCELGINDILGGDSAATVYGRLATIKGYFGSKTVRQTTLPPASTSTDSWATVGNQTTDATDAERVSLNGLIRANGNGNTVIYEIADVVESARDSGKWKAPGYTADGLHETTTAAVAIRDSGVIDPSVFTR